jgi:signal transduction histidine kinase
MIPKSIRWRLPLSYAAIALLATLVLGAVLLTSLRSYYAQREYDNLMGNAQVVGDIVGSMVQDEQAKGEIAAQVTTLSFVSQARIRLIDPDNNVLADSGNPFDKQIVSMMYESSPVASGAIQLRGDEQALLLDPDAADARFWIRSADGEFSAGGSNQPEQTTVAVPAIATTDRFTVALAGSPYGVGLRRDITMASGVNYAYSGQMVTFTMHDGDNNVLGTVEVSNGPAYGTEIIRGVIWALIGAGAAAVLLAAAAGWLVSRSITAPLLLLSNATERMANGQLSTRVHVQMKRGDEFGVLAQSFDEMAHRVEATVSALRRFVADAAHQIHTPLTAVYADLELAASEPNAANRLMFTERALVQLKRLEALTNDLLDLSRLEAHAVEQRYSVIDLVALVEELSEQFASRAEQAGISFNVETPPQPIKARIDGTQFRHALGNLLDNAIKFTPENGTITLGVRRDGDHAVLWVNDTGIGISDEDLPQIFNRFHRGRNAAAYPGSGLGLAILKAIVEGHHGQVSVQSSAGSGTHFALSVPAGA